MFLTILRRKKCATKQCALVYGPDHFKTHEIWNEAVRKMPFMLSFVPDHFKMQEMCNEIMSTMPDAFYRIPDRFKTQKMGNEVV